MTATLPQPSLELPPPETPIEILTGTARMQSHVVGVDRRAILVDRPAVPLPSRVVVRWTDRQSRQAVSLEALAAPLPDTDLVALAPVERPGIERRTRPRHAVPFRCAVDGIEIPGDGSRGRAFSGTLVDVSSAGLAFVTSVDMAPGSRVELTVKRPTGGAYLRSRVARVVQARAHDGRFRIGCDLSREIPNEVGIAALVEDAIAGKPL